MNAADLLDKAADLIWTRGRTVGRYEERDGALCVMGALERAGGLLDDRDAAQRALNLYLFKRGDSPPVAWNDSLPVSPENDAHVVDVMRRCAKQLREQAS